MRWILLAVGLVVAAYRAEAAVVVTYFGQSQWDASDATLGIAGYVIEDFNSTSLAAGLQIARSGAASGNFMATGTLPASSVFDPSTDPTLYLGQPLQAFLRGRWGGAGGVLLNHPGPSFVGDAVDWYTVPNYWADVSFTLPSNTISIGFSLQQMEAADSLYVNGVLFNSNLLASLGSDTETQAGLTFSSRNGYLRLDATGGDTIASFGLSNAGTGDGFAIDHLAFSSVAVAEPGTLAVLATGLVGLRPRSRLRRVSRRRQPSIKSFFGSFCLPTERLVLLTALDVGFAKKTSTS